MYILVVYVDPRRHVCDLDLSSSHQSGVFTDTVQYFDPLNESGGSSIIAGKSHTLYRKDIILQH